uniref:Uncharacterized protein n=1 Tax=Pygocentrus nattereri TaxID=42514 RepID=A0AAR2K632_PYGNA
MSKALKERMLSLKEVFSVEECDFILLFCCVASRAENNIVETLKKLRHVSDSKPAVLVVLHHTFDPDCTVPDSSSAVTRERTLTVDCLFHEDRGLLRCQRTFRVGFAITDLFYKVSKKTEVQGWIPKLLKGMRSPQPCRVHNMFVLFYVRPLMLHTSLTKG